jgi:hypothetical protein
MTAQRDIFLLDDEYQYQWELVTNPYYEDNDEEKASSTKPHTVLIQKATFPSPESDIIYNLIKAGNCTYIIDEWFNLAIKNRRVLRSTTMTRKVTEEVKKLFFYELSTKLFSMTKPGGSAWFRVTKRRGGGKGLPSPMNSMSHVSFYDKTISAVVLQLYCTIVPPENYRYNVSEEGNTKKRKKTFNYVLLQFNRREEEAGKTQKIGNDEDFYY